MTVLLPKTHHDLIPLVEHGPRGRTAGVVIHDIEGTAEGAISWFRGGAQGVGAHAVVGPEHFTQIADLDAKCWHAVNANSFAIGIEHQGFASWHRDQWLGEMHMGLELSAHRVAWIMHHYNLGMPVRHRNVWAHADGGNPWGGHHDPGAGFPWDHYMAMCQQAYRDGWGLRLARH